MASPSDESQVAILARRGELVRATGICSVCDFKFKNEVVLRYRGRRDPGGWLYIEPRHLQDGTYASHDSTPRPST
jgi:hypothetical protein